MTPEAVARRIYDLIKNDKELGLVSMTNTGDTHGLAILVQTKKPEDAVLVQVVPAKLKHPHFKSSKK